MPKVLLLNGSPHVHGCTATALEEMIKIFNEEGVETKLLQVGNKNIRGCIACGGCETRCPFKVPVSVKMAQTAELFGD